MAAPRSLGTLIAAALLCSGALGCTDDDETPTSQTLEWGLSDGNTVEDDDWPSDTTSFQLSQGVDVRLQLPEDRVYEDEVRQVMGLRQEDAVKRLDMSYPATSTEEAYEHAQELGEEWDVDLGNIDEWYERRTNQRADGEEDHSDTAATGSPDADPLGGSDGPTPAIEMFNSFDSEQPVAVQFSLVWPRSS